jgi:hypothetical protein
MQREREGETEGERGTTHPLKKVVGGGVAERISRALRFNLAARGGVGVPYSTLCSEDDGATSPGHHVYPQTQFPSHPTTNATRDRVEPTRWSSSARRSLGVELDVSPSPSHLRNTLFINAKSCA